MHHTFLGISGFVFRQAVEVVPIEGSAAPTLSGCALNAGNEVVTAAVRGARGESGGDTMGGRSGGAVIYSTRFGTMYRKSYTPNGVQALCFEAGETFEATCPFPQWLSDLHDLARSKCPFSIDARAFAYVVLQVYVCNKKATPPIIKKHHDKPRLHPIGVATFGGGTHNNVWTSTADSHEFYSPAGSLYFMEGPLEHSVVSCEAALTVKLVFRTLVLEGEVGTGKPTSSVLNYVRLRADCSLHSSAL